MSRSAFVSVAALFSLLNAIPGLVAPGVIASLYGVTLDPETVLIAQLLAASYIGYAVINWTSRGCTDLAVRRGIDVGNLTAWAASSVIWIYAASTGITNATGWIGAGFTLLFTLGWAYFAITDRAIGSRAVTAVPRA
jgi:hypothetical protein